MKEIFFETFFSLVRLFLSTKDDFLKQKLVKKTREFFDVFQDSANVVQSSESKLRIKSLEDLNEFIDILIHSKLVELSPALLVQKNLLHLCSKIMDMAFPKSKTGEAKASSSESLKNNPSGQKVVAYLKNRPDGAQAKEIFANFKLEFSRRSLQRYLNDLVTSGLIKKNKEGNFPKYYSN